jgi:RNA polymerase sigma factor (sigma-70 family)
MSKVFDGEDAAKQLFERYVVRLTALARSRLSSNIRRRLDPEDIVLSAFRSFFVGARENRWNTTSEDSIWSLLVMLTLRKLSRQTRRHRSDKRSVSRETEAPHDWVAVAREVPSAEEAALLADELEWLIESTTGLDREVLLLQLHGQEVADIARLLEISERTVRRSQQRTRESVTEDHQHAVLARNSIDLRSATDHARSGQSMAFRATVPVPTRSLEELKLHEMVGQGAFSKVFRATDRKLGHVVAVKFLKKASWSDARATGSFLREFEALSQLNNPHLLRVYGWGHTSRGAVFLVTEWIEGECLESWQIERRSIRNVLRIGCQISSGLIDAHAAGIWHCDLKPGNILLDGRGYSRLVDFGMARWGVDDDSPHGGTAGFLAPEQVCPAFGEVGERTDVYGLGATLYALLSGYAPCAGESVSDSISQVLSPEPVKDLRESDAPKPLRNIVMKALEKSPNLRWPGIENMVCELKGIEASLGEHECR